MALPNAESLQSLGLQKNYKILTVMSRAAVLAIALSATVAGISVGLARTGLFIPAGGDEVSDSEQLARLKAFNALGAFPLYLVSVSDMPAAINSMHLDGTAKANLLAELGASPRLPVDTVQEPRTAPSPDAQQASAVIATMDAAPATRAQGSMQAAGQSAAPAAMRLAWVRLWDSDVEDGDAVRIESLGYARTVVLTKQGAIFAIPVPPSGQVTIAGVRDGDGGGITVGLASGPTQALLPIMSVGQRLTLNVKVN